MAEYTCPGCGLVAAMSDSEWIAHRLSGHETGPDVSPSEAEEDAMTCPSESADVRCELRDRHDGDHTAYERTVSGRIVFTYRWPQGQGSDDPDYVRNPGLSGNEPWGGGFADNH